MGTGEKIPEAKHRTEQTISRLTIYNIEHCKRTAKLTRAVHNVQPF